MMKTSNPSPATTTGLFSPPRNVTSTMTMSPSTRNHSHDYNRFSSSPNSNRHKSSSSSSSSSRASRRLFQTEPLLSESNETRKSRFSYNAATGEDEYQFDFDFGAFEDYEATQKPVKNRHRNKEDDSSSVSTAPITSGNLKQTTAKCPICNAVFPLG